VLNACLHNPVMLAREVVTLVQLSGGRMELGLGAGHTPGEFAACGVPMEPARERKARLAEFVEIMRALLDGRTIAMLMTMIGDEHSSRPLTCVDVDGSRMSFLVDASTDWAIAVARGSAVAHLTVADERDNVYVALNGAATIIADRGEIDRLWNPDAGAFFSGKDDPNVAVLHFDATEGEYWDGPSGMIGAAISTIKVAVTGSAEAAGARGDVAVDGT